ncbi:hypothetical protein J2T17_004692 [Paenibacillus mucilaginosus]|uniref:hypothetical protein n=1 Tax=Paenibacillus mucilaginosus TaxID=61624 RepID=UPI003D1DCC32
MTDRSYARSGSGAHFAYLQPDHVKLTVSNTSGSSITVKIDGGTAITVAANSSIVREHPEGKGYKTLELSGGTWEYKAEKKKIFRLDIAITETGPKILDDEPMQAKAGAINIATVDVSMYPHKDLDLLARLYSSALGDAVPSVRAAQFLRIKSILGY